MIKCCFDIKSLFPSDISLIVLLNAPIFIALLLFSPSILFNLVPIDSNE